MVIRKKSITKQKDKREIFAAYMFILPDALGLLIFTICPIFYAFYISLTKWNGLTEKVFIGFKNYRKLVGDKEFLLSLSTTLKYAILYVVLSYIIGLLLAVLINSIKGRMQQVYRTLCFVPYAVSMVVAGVNWNFMIDNQKVY
jgi:multiple sugar transport system permease protein